MTSSIDPEKLYKAKELAEILGLGLKSLTREIKKGRLRASSMPNRTRLIFGRDALAYLRDCSSTKLSEASS